MPRRIWLLVLAQALTASVVHTQPLFLVSHGSTLYRVDGTSVESFPGQPASIIGMSLVPPGMTMTGASPGDVLAIEGAGGSRIWRVDSARSGTPILVEIGRFEPEVTRGDIAFAHGRMFGIQGDKIYEYDPLDFTVLAVTSLEHPMAITGGLTFGGGAHWYVLNQAQDRLIRLDDPPTAASWTAVGDAGLEVGNNDLEFFRGEVWAAFESDGRLLVGTVDTATGVFSLVHDVVGVTSSRGVGLAVLGSCTADYNGDTAPDVLDFLDFFEDFSACEDAPSPCGSLGNPDINGDTVTDILDFLDFFEAFSAGC